MDNILENINQQVTNLRFLAGKLSSSEFTTLEKSDQVNLLTDLATTFELVGSALHTLSTKEAK